MLVNGKLHQTMTKEQFVQLEETRPRLLQVSRVPCVCRVCVCVW
jgi:hypothetical protein